MDDQVARGIDGSRQRDLENSGQIQLRWPDLVDELIEEAMRDGLFDDLPGYGKPLDLSTNPYSCDAELAHQLLKNNDCTLPWIAERRAILEQIEELQKLMRHAGLRYEASLQAYRDTTQQDDMLQWWRNYLDQWEVEIDELNKMIAEINLKQPAKWRKS